MLGWLLQMTFQNGDIPLVNDSAFSINPTTKDLLEYAKRLGITSILKPLKESGYRKITFPLYECILDIGSIGPDYIPGHAHSDTFNFILYAKGNPFIIDTGISTYNPTERRNIERSTQAHNTVQINNYEQSEIWASFRVARRTVPKVLEETNNRYKASLDFATAKGLTHQRLFSFAENGMIIKDEVNVKDTSKAYLHFHPNVSASINGQEIVTNYGRIKVSNTCDVTLEKYQYAPTFNQLIPAKRAVITFTEFTTVTIEL